MTTLTGIKNFAASTAIVGALGFAAIGLGAGLAHADDTASTASSSSSTSAAASSATTDSQNPTAKADAAKLQRMNDNLQANMNMTTNTLDRINKLYSTISRIGN